MKKCIWDKDEICSHISAHPKPDGSPQKCNPMIYEYCDDFQESDEEWK